MQQLMLFPDTTTTQAALPCKRPRSPARRDAVVGWLQLGIAFVLRALDRDGDTDYDEPVRRLVKATDAPPVVTRAAPSVFDLAAAYKGLQAHGGRFGAAAGFEVPRYGVTVREGDVVRHIARREDETEAWAEKERARRARQRPPRPPRQQFKLKKSRSFADGKS